MEEIPFPNPVRYIEDALFCTGPFGLSYSDPDQKWIIRKHLISLFQDFASLKPSIGYFTHNDGTEVKLLRAYGEIRVSGHAPKVHMTIWVHEFYPQMAPIVYVDSTNPSYPIYENHPFVDSSSGSTVSPYLINWAFPKSNLSDMVRNLIKLFSLNHPFFYSGSSRTTHPSMVSRTEARDMLTCSIYNDMMSISSKTEKERENLSAVKAELENRASASENLLRGLELERKCLKHRVEKLNEESDKLLEWLKLYDKSRVISLDGDGIEKAFVASNKRSEILLELKSEDDAMEDVMYALEKAVEERVLSSEEYVKQVRALAREQFRYRAQCVEVEREK